MVKGKMSNSHIENIRKSLKKHHEERREKNLKPYHQAFGKDNPACNPDVKKKISNTVKKLWKDGQYEKRINGMLGKTGNKHHNYSPLTEPKFRFNKYLSNFQDITKCNCCGKIKKTINVHHIDEDHENFLITNLEPLCVKCHQLFHVKHFKQPYVTIRKEFVMESCHQLFFYNGPCGCMHGHSYKLFVSVKKRINPKTGMVMDFKELKNIVNEFVINKLDHYNLNDKMEFQTTAENMIYWIWKQLEEKALLKGLQEVTLYETKTSRCTITNKDVLEYETSLLYEDKEIED